MRNLWWIWLLAAVVACNGGESEGWDSNVDMAIKLIQSGQIEAGVDRLPEVTDGTSPAWLEQVTRALLDRRALEPAETLLGQHAPPSDNFVMLRAELLEYQDRIPEAKALYRSIDEDSIYYKGSLTKIGMIASLEQEYDEAIEAVRIVLADDPFDKVARAVLAESLLGKGLPEEAHQEAALLPEGTKRWLLDARIHLAQGEPAGALQPLRRALELKPGAPRPLYFLGQAFLGTGQWELAVKPLAKLAAFDPPYEDSQRLLATAYRRLGHTVQADSLMAAFQGRRDLEEAEALRGEGIGRSEAGQLDQALSYFQRALELVPDHPELHNDIGAVYARLKQYDDAERSFLRAEEISPANPAVQRNLANLYHITGDTERRDAAIDRYNELVGATEAP